ncbi:MAG: M23 family metallopeptidase [Myxococcota bacterium]
MSWRPHGRIQRSHKLPTPALIVATLVAVNAGVVIYHGDPRTSGTGSSPGDKPTPDIRGDTSTASDAVPATATPPELVGPPLTTTFDPRVGLRIPGPVQRVDLIRVRAGESAAQALLGSGAKPAEVECALQSLKPLVDFRRLRPGDEIKARFDAHDALLSVEILRGPLEQTRADLREGVWQAARIDVSTDTILAQVSGEVTSSLWDTLLKSGEDPRLVAQIVDIFAWDIDFYSEIYPGDTFRLVVEKRYGNGQFLDYGAVHVAELVSAGSPHRAFAHPGTNGTLEYFDEEGQSLHKQLLKSPLKYAHVTSRYGTRVHPILGYNRKHNGIDYGAPVGTPVWAVGDAKVTYAGWRGGYGKYVELRHANGWVSEYGHLSHIDVRAGQHVAQKQVIARTGSSGLSTGPHLHYGLRRSGTFVNPLTQKLERGRPLTGNELTSFRQRVVELLRELDRVQVARDASAKGPQEG